VQQALPYLRKLGITAIYLNPIFEAESMHKYDTSDFRHVDDNFGVKGDLGQLAGETDDPTTWKWSKSDLIFLDFVKEARRQGFKVIIDGVFNHVGKAHPFFQDVVKNGKGSKYADWFEISDWGTGGEPGTPGGIQWKAWDKANGELPVFKKDPARGLAPGPYAHIMAITKRWLAPDGDVSRGVDGFRLDVPGDIPHPFWVEWRKLVKSTNPDAYITGEIWQWAQAWLGGDQFDAVMNYQFAMAAQDFFVDVNEAIRPSDFASRLTRVAYAYPFQVALAQQNLFDSHDTDRLASMFVNPDRPYDGRNRLQDNGPDYNPAEPTPQQRRRMLQAVAMQMSYVGAPMVYYGDEAGMWSPDDPSNRQPMVWKDLEPFDEPRVRFNDDVFEAYRRAIGVRQALEPLQTGAFQPTLADDQAGVIAFARESSAGRVNVVINRSDREARIALPVGAGQSNLVNWLDPAATELADGKPSAPDARPTLRLKPGARTIAVKEGVCTITLPPYGTAVLAPPRERVAAQAN
jgi:glycosidase